MEHALARKPTGVLLAGGASRRLGYDKATVRLPAGGPAPGLSLLEWGVMRLRPLVDRVLLADRGRFEDEGRSLDVTRVHDGDGKGPAAGILGAAAIARGQSLLVLACDLPWVSPALLEQIMAANVDADWVVARTEGGLEPLCALYRKAALDALEAQVSKGRFALYPLRELVRTHEVRTEREQLLNLNTPQDVARLGPREARSDGDEG